MRVMMTVTIPHEPGNAALKSGKLQQIIQNFVQQYKPEAAYFSTNPDGERGGIMVFDLQDSSEMPKISEPLFQELGARITFKPCMNLEDLKKGLSSLELAGASRN
ncbi:MAG: hypothetical protein ACRENA_12315 [Vulcanimicrobiaceae bacterium]